MELPAGNGGSSQAFVKGDALKDNGSGYLIPAASGDNTGVKYIAWETKTVTTTGTLLLVYRIVGGVQLEADTSNTVTQTQVHTEVDLSAAGTLDTSATTDQLFYVEKFISTSKVLGYFVDGVPNS